MVRRCVGILQLAMIALFALIVCSDPSASASTAQQGPATPVAGATPAMPATLASAAASPEPARCQVGLTVTALYGLNVTANTFDAEFWV